MWLGADSFKRFVDGISSKDIRKLLNLKDDEHLRPEREEKVRKRLGKIIFSILPLSIIIYMCEHLTNPNLKNTIQELIKKTTNVTQKLFYSLLLFHADFNEGMGELEKIVGNSSSPNIPFIIVMFIRFYCHEHIVADENFEKIANLIRMVRKNTKPALNSDEDTPFYKDTFEVDFMKELQTAKTKLEISNSPTV
jgi:hypothetical protein